MIRRYRRSLVALVCQVLVLQATFKSQLLAQRVGLRIVIVQGEGARNRLQQITPRPLIVRVENGNNRPVSGATVVFTTPEGGPGGEFANDSRVISVMTGADGVAESGAYHPNGITGSYQIQIRAEYQGETAMVQVSQINIEQTRGRGKKIAIIAIAGGAALAAITARSKSSSSAPTITFGGTVVGAPR